MPCGKAAYDDDWDGLCNKAIDWCRCDLLESVPGKVSGAWVMNGTRTPAQVIADSYDACVDPPEIAAAYGLDVRLVEAIVGFAGDQRTAALRKALASAEFVALLNAAPSSPPVGWSGRPVVEWMAGPAHDTWVLVGTPALADVLMGHHDGGWRLEYVAGTCPAGGTKPRSPT